MQRIEDIAYQMRGTVTYALPDGRRVRFDARAVREFGIEALMKAEGLADMIPTGRLDVFQHGKKVGTVPAAFEPIAVKSTSFWYNVRPGDFVREGDRWNASRTLGPGDLEAVPGFVWDRQ